MFDFSGYSVPVEPEEDVLDPVVIVLDCRKLEYFEEENLAKTRQHVKERVNE